MRGFLARTGEVNRELEGLAHTLEEMKNTTRKVSGATTEKETKGLRNALTQLRDEFVEGMNTTKTKIQQQKEKAAQGKTEKEKHTKEQHVASLVERAKKLVEEFSTTQAEFGAEERDRLKSQYIIARPSATKEELDKAEYTETADPFAFGKKSKSETQERRKSLMQISHGIEQVTQMTEQLNLLVHTTDKNIDKVAVTTTKTEKKAKKADKKLKQALKYQKLARLAKIIAISIVSIIFIVILLGIGFCIVFVIIFVVQNISLPSAGDGSAGDNGAGNANNSGAGGNGGAGNANDGTQG